MAYKNSSVLNANLTVALWDNYTSNCLQFNYFMFSGNMSFAVYVKSGNHSEMIWSKRGDQGFTWRNASVQLPNVQQLRGLFGRVEVSFVTFYCDDSGVFMSYFIA